MKTAPAGGGTGDAVVFKVEAARGEVVVAGMNAIGVLVEGRIVDPVVGKILGAMMGIGDVPPTRGDIFGAPLMSVDVVGASTDGAVGPKAPDTGNRLGCGAGTAVTGGKLAANRGVVAGTVGAISGKPLLGIAMGIGVLMSGCGMILGALAMLGSIVSDLGSVFGITEAPCGLVSAFLIKKHAMLNSSLSNLPSLLMSAKFHI